MVSLVVVHGTGVRKEGYDAMFALVEARAKEAPYACKVVRCFWGEKYGAHVNEAFSVPGDSLRAIGDEELPAEPDLALWYMLLHDPLYELRGIPPGRAVESWGDDENDETTELAARVRTFKANAAIKAWLKENALEADLDASRAATLQSDVVRELIGGQIAEPDHVRSALARAVTAALFIRGIEKGMPLPDVEERDEFVALIERNLGGTPDEATRNVATWPIRQLAGLGRQLVTWKVKRERVAITRGVTAQLGDILHYQARGGGIRGDIKKSVTGASGDVYLLAHSLGGIACVDLLILDKSLEGKIKGVITFGSQAPFLYEMNALVSLEKGERLPDHFPPWLNIYDQNDLLSYVAEPVFDKPKNPIHDFEVKSGQPDVVAHSAYLKNDPAWDRIWKFVA